MIITFFGHSDFISSDEHKQRLIDYLEQKVGSQPVDFYLGGYGAFDCFAFACCKKFKETHPNAKLIFITPYITENYQKNHLKYAEKEYDLIIYPELERVPPQYAISRRNKWIVAKSDVVIAYVEKDFGGAYQALKQAIKKGKITYNLAKTEGRYVRI